MKIYTNHELNEYIKDNISDTWEERDFVAYARKYFHGRQDKIMAIGGLRGTGKTTGLLQAVNGLNACYITAQQKEEETADDYIDFIRNTDAKYIIIDEYSWINNREELDKYLYTAVQNGKRIAITGTESITLEYLNYNTLIHRVDMVHVTMFTYEEHCRLYHMEPSKKNREDYLLNGGLFSEYAVTNYETMQNYIKTAIIDNLAAYMGSRMSKEKAAALVYSVLYKAICPNNLSTVPELAKNQLSVENFLSEMGIDTQIEFSDKDVRNVADIFEQIGLIVRMPNYDKTSPIKEQYYITNPSLSCQLILAAYNIKEISSDILIQLFEAIQPAYKNQKRYNI